MCFDILVDHRYAVIILYDFVLLLLFIFFSNIVEVALICGGTWQIVNHQFVLIVLFSHVL